MDSYFQLKSSKLHPVPAAEFQLFLSLIIGFRFNCFGDPVSLSTRGDAEIPGCWLQAVLAHMLLSTTCWKVNKSMALLAEKGIA